MRPVHEVADVLQRNHYRLDELVTNSWKLRTLYALAACRTPAMGGHIDQCTNPDCNKIHISYNSCRNRHCPKCQGHKREEWIRARESELINAPYFHVVFTVPNELHEVFLQYPKELYSLLFKVSWSVISDFSSNPKFIGGKTGMIAILHTWGQNISFHPHLHCVIPGGGITPQGKWRNSKAKGKFLFPVKAMSKVFRARFAEELRKFIYLDDNLYRNLFAKKWVVYCKRPFFGPKQVIEYLGRYTHKVAISNHRIKSLDNASVTFSAKDYRKGGKIHSVSLKDEEFIRRFSLHILPKRFIRIRHYGILSSTLKQVVLRELHEELGIVVLEQKEPIKHGICPYCKKGELVTIMTFDNRGPPKRLIGIDHKLLIALKK